MTQQGPDGADTLTLQESLGAIWGLVQYNKAEPLECFYWGKKRGGDKERKWHGRERSQLSQKKTSYCCARVKSSRAKGCRSCQETHVRRRNGKKWIKPKCQRRLRSREDNKEKNPLRKKRSKEKRKERVRDRNDSGKGNEEMDWMGWETGQEGQRKRCEEDEIEKEERIISDRQLEVKHEGGRRND